MSRKHWYEIDNLYTMGTFLVILGHSHSSDWDSFAGRPLETMINFIYLFHMPLFFFIAGFLFDNSKAPEKNGYVSWLKKKAVRLLTPYVVLSVIALIPKYYFENHSWSGIGSYVLRALVFPREGVWGHFWFLPVLLLVYAIFGIWKVTAKGFDRKGVLPITFLAALLLYFLPLNTNCLGISDLHQALVYFVLGMLLHRLLNAKEWQQCLKGRKQGVYALTMLAELAISAIGYHYFYSNIAYRFAAACLMILFCLELAEIIGELPFCKWISSNNFTIYIYSWPAQAVAMVFASRIGFGWLMTSVMMFMTGILVPVCMILIYRRLKPIHNMFFDLVLGLK